MIESDRMIKKGKVEWRIDNAAYQNWIENVERTWRENLADNYKEYNSERNGSIISIVMPVYNTAEQYLREALDSVRDQTYPNWQLCIVDDASTEPYVNEIIQEYSKLDSRITAYFRKTNGGIGLATNDAIALVKGEFIAFLDHDDRLAEHALLAVSDELRKKNIELEILYTDSDNLDVNGKRCNPFFKPEWNYELFLGQNYLNHLTVIRTSLIMQLGGLRCDVEGSQDYDLLLRAIEKIKPDAISHIAKILYHWRVVKSSVSRSNIGKAVKAARQAIGEHLERTRQAAHVSAAKNAVIYNRVLWKLPDPTPSVVIIVFGDRNAQIEESVDYINSKTRYRNYTFKTVSVDSREIGKATQCPSYSSGLHSIVSEIDADVLCFIQAGLRPVSNDWLENLVVQAIRPSVGVVSSRLESFCGLTMAGPIFTGMKDAGGGGVLGCSFKDAAEKSKGYFARLLLDQQVTVVHGAYMVCERAIYNQFGGINSGFSHPIFFGADLSLRLSEEGLCSIWSANATMRVFNKDLQSNFQVIPLPEEADRFEKVWSQKIKCDANYNPNFDCKAADFELLVQFSE